VLTGGALSLAVGREAEAAYGRAFGALGTLARNAFHGRGINNFDIGLLKNLKLTEQTHVQIALSYSTRSTMHNSGSEVESSPHLSDVQRQARPRPPFSTLTYHNSEELPPEILALCNSLQSSSGSRASQG
jgi:hypothetical protein